ncbi:MAG: two-component sensor kinase [Candidatus Scalindua rubra]|uniref:histidine kinase n=1 Tax=Candidatus Scalindua rubra TaxID=1872076 RepID=A0A1E3XFP4_9BACT|nr:MAG: two-component sensor kinase [Candidatus Scalindua rubra]
MNKELEEQIQDERKIFDNVMDIIRAGLCLLDENLRIIWANNNLRDWLDLKESPVGKHCHDIYHCSEVETDNCPAVQAFKGKEDHIIETWVTTKAKKRMCIQHVAIPITNKKGVIDNVLLLTGDVTESEKLMHRLLLLQQFGEITQGTLHLDKLIHLILTCITASYSFGFNRAMLFLINKEHNVLNGKLAVGPSSSEEATQIWKEMSSKHNSLADIIDKLDYSHNIDTPLNTMIKLMAYSLSDTREVVVSCAKGKKPIIIKNADNDTRVTEDFRKVLGVNEFVCVPLIAKNEPTGVIVADNAYTREPISEDRVNTLTMFANQAALAIENAETYKRLEDKINQLTETQQRLIRSEKLAAIGSMSSYIAHEIRNPLVTIGGFAKFLSSFDFTDSKIKTNIDIIIEEVKRLEKILNNITDFSRPSTPEKVNVQICEIIENTCILMENYLQEKHINLHKDFESDIPQIFVDPIQMKQVFLNILMNAVESMPDGGDLDVKIKSANESIEIDVIDNGKGIPQESLQNIFYPFFTTKPNGTGVGLAVSLKIIEDHGGNIDVKSKYGKGTTISLTLPIKY